MSAPRASSPHRLSFDQGRYGFQSDRLQIRAVPYSPPRPDDSTPTSPPLVPYASVSSRPKLGNFKVDGQHEPPAILDSLNAMGKAKQPCLCLNRHVTPEGTKLQPSNRKLSVSSSPSLSSSPSPWRRPKRVINLHPDGTFSLVQQQTESISSRTDFTSSPGLSSAIPSGSCGRMSSTTATTSLEDCNCSSRTPVAEQKQQFLTPSSPAQSSANFSVSESLQNAESSPNYLLSASARKIPNTALNYGSQLSSPSQSFPSQTPLPFTFTAEDASVRQLPVIPLGTKHSFQSSISGSMFSERTNYQIYARSSPRSSSANDFTGLDLGSPVPSSSGSDYAAFHDNESVAQSDDHSALRSDQSEANYILHGRSRSSSFLTSSRSRVRPEYSQESLVIAPLRPMKQAGSKRSIHAKSRSCDSSMTTTSSKTTSSRSRTESLRSLSNFVYSEAPHVMDTSFGILSNDDDKIDDQQSCSHGSPSAPCKNLCRQKHWSSTLSTVMSEAENRSEPPSRSLSPLFNSSRDNEPHSNHSRQNASFSSSLTGLDETLAMVSHSRTATLDRPPAVHNREAMHDQRLIRDHDEDGDGLAELEDMHRRLSRFRRHNLSSNGIADRNLHSSHSSRSSRANSLNRSSIPQWARLYYGSGERRFLTSKLSRESLASNFSESQAKTSILSRSPSVEVLATEITNPRKRPRECLPPDSDDISEVPLPSSFRLVARSIKRQTSSIWSPHLRRDRRAGQYSIWTPPSLTRHHGSPCSWQRNIQVALFVTGFLLPFGWMIGGILPLPTNPALDMTEPGHSTSHVELGLKSHNQVSDSHATGLRDQTKWWRGINRRMSVLGILLVGAYVTLAVIGVHQQWATH